MNLKIVNRARRCVFAALLLSMSMCTGCLALSFGGKTEMNNPVELDRITKLEQRMQNVEKYVGIQSPPENVRYANNRDTDEALPER